MPRTVKGHTCILRATRTVRLSPAKGGHGKAIGSELKLGAAELLRPLAEGQAASPRVLRAGIWLVQSCVFMAVLLRKPVEGYVMFCECCRRHRDWALGPKMVVRKPK